MLKTTKKKNLFNIIAGDLFEGIELRVSSGNNGCSVVVPHVCNNVNAFGAGFAGAVAAHYPIVKENYHLLGSSFLKKNPGHTQFVTVYTEPKYKYKIIFANMIAQNGIICEKNYRPINYAYLVKSMLNVKQYINNNFDTENRVEIHAPKFGCGLAGGRWEFIENIIEDIWENFTVRIYDYKK